MEPMLKCRTGHHGFGKCEVLCYDVHGGRHACGDQGRHEPYFCLNTYVEHIKLHFLISSTFAVCLDIVSYCLMLFCGE